MPWAIAGMRYSLPSRELIEDSIEIMAEAHQLDGLVMIPSCDKIVPGHIMAAGRLDLPTIVITGGPMMPGFACDKELDLINVFEGWQAGGETLDALEEMACPGAGSCAGLFTANTMACLTEAMGLSLPGCATTHAVDALKIRYAKQSGMKIMELVERGITARQIVTNASLDNAIRVDMAIGGSTNTVLHMTGYCGRVRTGSGFGPVRPAEPGYTPSGQPPAGRAASYSRSGPGGGNSGHHEQASLPALSGCTHGHRQKTG